MSTTDDFDQYLDQSRSGTEQIDPPLVIDVPTAPPQLDRRQPPLLSRSRYAVGLEAPPTAHEPAVSLWQIRVVLWTVIALISLFVAAIMLSGEWILLLIALPIAGLLLAGIWRSYQAELAASRKKKARQARRLRDSIK